MHALLTYEVAGIKDILVKTPLFGSLEDKVLNAFIESCEVRELDAGEVLFNVGEPYNEEIYIPLNSGLEITGGLNELEHPAPGYLVGLSSYFSNAPYNSTASAETSIRMLVISAEKLQSLEQQYPSLFDAMNRLIAECLRERSISQAPISGALTKEVRNFMSTPIITCLEKDSLASAFELMQQNGISSLAVLDDSGQLVGHLRYSGIARAMIQARNGDEPPLAGDACETAGTVEVDMPLWRAEEVIDQRNSTHVIVTEDGSPVGMLSQKDIMHALISQHSFLRSTINSSRKIKQLVAINKRIPQIADELLTHNRSAVLAVQSLSEIHLAIQNRCIELTLESMKKSDYGDPPVPFAFIIMGSGGRREMLLNPDQDNGLIIADHDKKISEKVNKWFDEFSRQVTKNLDKVGYDLCKGDIMASNPMYRKTISAWKRQIKYLVRHPSEKSARWSNVVFDFRTQYGDSELTHELRSYVIKNLQRHPKLLQFMVHDDAEGRPAIDWLNRLIVTVDDKKSGKIDLKRNGLRIIADAARILSLQHGIKETNTAQRLQKLEEHDVITSDFRDTLVAAHEELLDLMLAHQIEQQKKGVPLDKMVIRHQLPSAAREALRIAMRAVKRFQDYLQDQIGTLEY